MRIAARAMVYKTVKYVFSILLVVGFALSSNVSYAAKKTKITIALARNVITPAEENYMFAIPKQLGFFKAHNMDVEILPTEGSTAAIQAVVSGSADIAFASSINIAAAVDKGVPVIAFAGVTTSWPYYIGVTKGSAIKKIEDLKGKRIGVISMASASYFDLLANLHAVGLSEDDVSIVPVGAGVRAAAALKADHIDAIDSYTDSFVAMEQNGIALDYLKRPEKMDQLFSVTMVTTRDVLVKKRQALIDYVREAYRGTIYSYLNPEKALLLAYQEFPELAGADDPQGSVAQATFQQMLTALRDSVPHGQKDPSRWGQWFDFSDSRWGSVLDFAYQSGLTSKKLMVQDVWDRSLLPEIYHFDVATIKEMQ